MKIFNLYSGSWRSNCYLLADMEAGEAVLIDPSEDAGRIVGFAESHGVKIVQILLTHGHFDHILSLDALRTLTGAPMAMHGEDAECLSDPSKSAFDLVGGNGVFKAPERILRDGSIVELAGHKIRVIHTPGHTKGSCCYAVGDRLFTGDTLFVGGTGRCDLYGGSYSEMRRSLEKLSKLETDYKIYPGHGESGRLMEEINNNI